MYEIVFHGRGGQGALMAAKILAHAYFFDGKFVEAFPQFGGERRGAPVRAFLRVDANPIRMKVPILVADCAMIMDASLLDFVDITQGLKESGLILLNSPRKPEEIKLDARRKIATCDASGISRQIIKRDIPNSALLGAFAYATKLSMESLAKAFKEIFVDETAAAKNIEMARLASQATTIGFSSVETAAREHNMVAANVNKLETGGTFKADVSALQNITGSWTTEKAVIDEAKCNFCLLCYAVCPEGCILRKENKLKIDEDYCKGCGICAETCPVNAISMEKKRT